MHTIYGCQSSLLAVPKLHVLKSPLKNHGALTLEGLYLLRNGRTCYKSESHVKFEVELVRMG